MRRFIACLLIVIMLLSVAACGGKSKPVTDPAASPDITAPPETVMTETQPQQTQPEEPEVELLSVLIGSHYEDEWNDDLIRLAYVEWDGLLLGDECAAQYPNLAAALEAWNENERELALEDLEAMLPDARDMAAEYGEEFGGYLDSAVCVVQRADDRILSVRCPYEGSGGNMRPYYGTTVLNLDPATGEALTVDDILTDTEGLPQLLEDALLEKYTDFPPEVLSGVAEYLESYSLDAYTWTLDYQGITFYFGVSELAASAVGELSVTLWFDRYPELIVSKYTQLPPNGYARMLSQLRQNDVDLDPDDGTRDQLYVNGSMFGELAVGLNDHTVYEDDYYAYSMDAYLATPDYEHYYLYLDSVGDNDYHITYVYDLSGEQPEFVTALSGDSFAGQWVDDGAYGSWYTFLFNDPTEFVMDTRIDLLGTMTGTRVCHISPETAVPQGDTECYTLPDDRPPLVSKIPLNVQMLPDLVTETVPAGTKYYFLRTDNRIYVDMRLEDCRECRIQVSFRDWQVIIDGMTEDECFDGIMYAG